MNIVIKIKVLISILLFVNYGFSQSLTIKTIESRLVTHQGVEFVGELKDVSNDHYSFSNWSNEGVLYLNNTHYKISNINFNASTNSFESRIDRKKNFAYKNGKIDSVSINNSVFKKIDDYFYEILNEIADFYFLKKHDIKYHAGTINRMNLMEGEGYTSLDYKYLIRIGGDYRTVSLNKKSILGLVESRVDQDNLSEYVKKNKLSYKQEDDVSKILQFLFLESGMRISGV